MEASSPSGAAGQFYIVGLGKIKVSACFFLLIVFFIGTIFFILYLENYDKIQPYNEEWFFYFLVAPFVVLILFTAGIFFVVKESGYIKVDAKGIYHILSKRRYGIFWDEISEGTRDQIGTVVFYSQNGQKSFTLPSHLLWTGKARTEFAEFLKNQCETKNIEIRSIIQQNFGLSLPIHYNCELP